MSSDNYNLRLCQILPLPYVHMIDNFIMWQAPRLYRLPEQTCTFLLPMIIVIV